jgi:hypothetical protein
MHYKLLGFSQMSTVRTFWFHRIGPLGTAPVAFSVVTDTCVARKCNLPLQELPSLCSRMLNATSGDEPAGALTLGERDIAAYAAELDQARAAMDAARMRRALQCSHIRKPTVATQTVDPHQSAIALTLGQ